MVKNSGARLKVQFWGVRGSIPSPPDSVELERRLRSILKMVHNRQFVDEESIEIFIDNLPKEQRYFVGGNTACVHVQIADKHLIFDAGSGIRKLGESLMHSEFSEGKGTAHIFISHTHWDHISGFPFFQPAYVSGNRVLLYGVHNGLEQRFNSQQEDEYYPVSLSAMGANIEFVQLRKDETIDLDGVKITNKMLNHPGGSFGYRVEFNGRSLVYATDSEYTNMTKTKIDSYLQFFKNADVVIFDGQFTEDELVEKENWGHSTLIHGIDFAHEANVRHLILFHHDPSYSDEKLHEMIKEGRKYVKKNGFNKKLKISLAIEGIELTI
ncbi:MAG: MBL fold metallo-hydrolase [Candidatus Neomarinimicrobiota bacterium]